ncbi:MAG TPA: Ig-like domain-containing protein [Bacilli bacterium]|nr:Ig-like domain-containing protein [Bacilli bacterium]
MKKWITFLLTLTLMFVFIGCGDPVEEVPDKEDPVVQDVLPSTITITNGVATMNVGDTQALTIEITPSTTTNKSVTWKSSNEAVLRVDSSGGLTALTAGTTTVTVTSKAKSSVKATLDVTVSAVHVDVASLSVSGRDDVEVGKSITLMTAVLPKGANTEVTFASSDVAIATVDANGKVTGVAEGTVIITAASKENVAITATKTVVVKAASSGEPEENAPTSVIVQGSENSVFEGKKISFNATVYPEGSSQNVTWHSRKEDVATISSKGVVTGISAGITYIYAKAVADDTIQSDYFKVTVVEYVEVVVTYPDLQGYAIQLMYHSTFDPYSEKYGGNDKAAKQQAIEEVKSLYNVTFEYSAFGEDASWGPNRVAWINGQAESGTTPVDFYDVTVGWIKQLVDGKAVVQLDEYYLKWGQGSMPFAEKAATTVQGKLYGVSEGQDPTAVNIDLGIYYNYGMLKKYNLISPAQLFNEGTWSYADFSNWVKAAQAVLPPDTFVLSGHPYYFWFGMVNAGGIKITDTASKNVNIKHAYARQSTEVLRELYLAGAYEKSPTWAETDGMFIEGKSLCSSGSLWFVRHSARWSGTLFGEGSTEYGYVPFPWPNNKTKEDTRISTGGDTGFVMTARSRPTYVDNESLYRVLQEYFLLSRKYQLEDPQFDADAYLEQYATGKFDDPQSITALLYLNDTNKLMFDPGHAFYDSISGSPMGSNIMGIVVNGVDFDASMDEDIDSYRVKFLQYYA